MKKLMLFAVCLYVISMSAQIEVTTITPEIKGSGGLSLDALGNLYIGDFGDFLSVGDGDGVPNLVMKLDQELNLTEYSTGFVGASGNDFDSNGVLFQSDIRAGAIYKIVAGVRTFVTNTGISAPVGIVFDSQDNFYVCNCGNNTIRKVTPEGVSTNFAPSGLYQCPNGITVDEYDNLYVSNFNNGNILKITQAEDVSVLNVTPSGSTGNASNGHLDYFEPTRTLFIASHGANKIYMLRLDDSSNLQWIAGSGVRGNADGDAVSASFSRPNGVAVSVTGDSIYINSAIPVTNVPNGPLNPQVIRLITGVNSILSVNSNVVFDRSVSVYPNPASDKIYFYIEDTSISITSIQLYDMVGKKIKDIEVNKREVGLSTLSKGIYFLKFTSNSNTITKRFVKR